MRTDDFDGPKSQDHNDNRAEMNATDIDGDGFNEFDTPTSSGKQSLGDLWRNNPLIKIGVVVVVLIVGVTAMVMFGGSDDKIVSKVGSTIEENEAPGNETPESYREAVDEVNQQRLEHAQMTGESTIPIPTASPDTSGLQPSNDMPPIDNVDPLQNWRAAQQDVPPEATLAPTSPQMMPDQQARQQQVAMGPDPAAVDALANAMSQQMSRILGKHEIRGPEVMEVTSRDYYTQAAEEAATAAAAGTAPEEPEVREILIPAGTIVYAQTLTEANTDAPGPVLARISSGPLLGSRILGSFNNTDEYLRLEFNTVVIKGISQPTNAIALDPKTTLPAVATEIDRRYWRRVIFPAAASFIQGMGDAVAQNEQTVVVSDGVSTSSQDDLNTRQELAAGLAEGTSELSDQLDEEGDRTRTMIKVHSGTPIGVLFLEPVLKDPDQ